MKTLKNTRFMFAAVAALLFVSSKTLAAVNAYLWFDDGKGKITKVSLAADGSFKTPTLPEGTYSVSFGVGRGISSPTGGSSDRESSAPSVSEITVSYEITAPRDAQSGMATGKRMHKPITITKELDKFSMSSGGDRPQESLSFNFTKIIVNYPNDGISGTLTLKSKNGKTIALDSLQK